MRGIIDMGIFKNAFQQFLLDKDSASFISSISSLIKQSTSSQLDEEDIYELNKYYTYESQKLSPLSILIRMASSIDNPIPLIESLIRMGANINVDYGYHGDRHPDRPLPPLIEAIQLSVKDEKKEASAVFHFDLYTEISQLLLKHGAKVNKVGDNMSPLLACYNIKLDKMISEDKEKPATPEEIKQFAARKRNLVIFKELLKHKDIHVQEIDILSNVEIEWRKKDKRGSFGFQLLNIIDAQLKIYPNKKLEKDFFEPLFEKFLQSSNDIVMGLDKPGEICRTQADFDESFKAGLLFSSVTRRPESKITKIANRIAVNDEIFVEDLVKPVLKEKVKKMQCLAGMYAGPRKYFGSNDKVLMEGLLYHAYDVYPLMHAKSDLFSWIRKVHYKDKTVLTYSFEDFTYKIKNYSFFEMFKKMEKAEQRRLGKIPEVRQKIQKIRSGGKSDSYHVEDYDESGELKKKAVKKHYTLIYDHKNYEFSKDDQENRSPLGVYHNEMLCYIAKPIAILSVYRVDLTVEKEASTRDHDWIDVIHEELANLRDLQRQRHYFYLTGEMIPIVKADSRDNCPILVETTDFEALTRIFTKENNIQKLFEYASLFIDEEKWGSDFRGDIIQFYREGPESFSKNPNNLLLWALSHGFSDSAKQMLSRDAKVDPNKVRELGILDEVLKKGYLDEAKFLINAGCVPNDKELINAIKSRFGENALNNPNENLYYQPTRNILRSA
jgi:hypothetical protein